MWQRPHRSRRRSRLTRRVLFRARTSRRFRWAVEMLTDNRSFFRWSLCIRTTVRTFANDPKEQALLNDYGYLRAWSANAQIRERSASQMRRRGRDRPLAFRKRRMVRAVCRAENGAAPRNAPRCDVQGTPRATIALRRLLRLRAHHSSTGQSSGGNRFPSFVASSSRFIRLSSRSHGSSRGRYG